MSRSGYQRGVEPWETSPGGGRQPRELRQASPKSGEQRRRARARTCRILLLLMILVTLGAGIAHCVLEGVPFSQLSKFSAVTKVENLPDNGLFYTIFQFCSSLSCVAAWLTIRIPAAYPLGLLLLPVLLLLGWALLSPQSDFGYNLMMTVLVLTELYTGIHLILGLLLLVFSGSFLSALLQLAFYAGLFLFPLLELIVLHKWKENT